MAALVAACATAAVPSSFGGRVSVDEPQYLLTALSLAEDRSLDVSDELADERWRAWHAADLPRQTEPRADGSEVSPHDPGLPLLLAVPLAAGGWAGARAVMVVLAALLAAGTATVAVRLLGVPVRLAAAGAAVAGASAPLAVYGSQVYPELPAALVVLAAAAGCLSLPRSTRARPVVPALGVPVAAVAVVALPWLSVKYVPVALVLALALLARLRRAPLVAVAVLGTWTAAAVVYAAAHRAWYGGWTVYASGDHFTADGELAVVGTEVDLLGRSTRLLGLLLDADFGLVVWQPAWLLLVPALAWLLRHRPAGWDVLAGGLAAGWATATWVALTMHGYWWPGRQVVVVLPLGVLAVLAWLAAVQQGPHRTWWGVRAVAAVLCALGVLTLGWLVADGLAGTLTWVAGADRVGDPLHAARRALLPDYRVLAVPTWVRQALWFPVLAAVAMLGWRTGASPDDDGRRARVPAPPPAPTAAAGRPR